MPAGRLHSHITLHLHIKRHNQDCRMYINLKKTSQTLFSRNFLRSHRSGPLRFMISQRDDQPPPYGNYDPNVTINVDPDINGDVVDSTGPV